MPQDFKRDIAAGMLQLAHIMNDLNDCTADEITPFCLEAIYRGAIFYAQEYSRTGEQNAAISCREIKEALVVISKRWRAAGNSFFSQNIQNKLKC